MPAERRATMRYLPSTIVMMIRRSGRLTDWRSSCVSELVATSARGSPPTRLTAPPLRTPGPSG